ncbi:MAG: hypothetical protein JMDDDDMK_00903 [Acidobacteria bacterium]|nr:hypothetical protein [Acidobacteriota bacterium]
MSARKFSVIELRSSAPLLFIVKVRIIPVNESCVMSLVRPPILPNSAALQRNSFRGLPDPDIKPPMLPSALSANVMVAPVLPLRTKSNVWPSLLRKARTML